MIQNPNELTDHRRAVAVAQALGLRVSEVAERLRIEAEISRARKAMQ